MKSTNLKNALLLASMLILGATQTSAYVTKYHNGILGTLGLRNYFDKVESKIASHTDASGNVVIDQVDVYCKGRGQDACKSILEDIPARPEINSYPALEANFSNEMVERATILILNGQSTGTFDDVLVISKPDGTLVSINFTITWTANDDGSADFSVNRLEN